MGKKVMIFDDSWLTRARGRSGKASWADDVMAAFDTVGGIYLLKGNRFA
jgi:hypothetical protein